MRIAFAVLFILITVQTALAECSKRLLSAEAAEGGSWSINFGISSRVVEILNGVKGPADVAGAAERVYCILVDAEMPTSVQDSFLGAAIGKIQLGNAGNRHLETLGVALARYGFDLEQIGRNHDADSVAIFVFVEQPTIFPHFLAARDQLGHHGYTAAAMPQLVRTRKLTDYAEAVESTDGTVAKLLGGALPAPNLTILLAAIEKEEEKTIRALRRGTPEKISLFLGGAQDPVEELRIVDGAPKSVIRFYQWSPYRRAVADFEGRAVLASEKFEVECRFPPQQVVKYGERTERWDISLVSFENMRLVLDCSVP